ncbi:MAG: NAD(P)H-dependent glycerol-3-phosphate dehydrogenase [Epsilonproteobacteria bacterium]|nr:MAG: NAD(P)H-dependent glycerol-3-phosphate dehydrogenase [Campylobacterota bacterium]
MKDKIAVIGAGKWGQALYESININHKCFITSRTKKNIKHFCTLQEALDCQYIIIAISTQHISSWLENNFINKNQKILVASKGIEAKTGRFLKEIYEQHIDIKNLGFVSGPSFAYGVKAQLPTALVINSISKEYYDEFALFFPKFIKTYYSDDIIGAEIAGAYKNVIAIAGGICDGLKLGDNARAGVISRGLVEMSRFGYKFGATTDSFVGLSGAGDLFLTASSNKSRNYKVGLGLSKNIPLPQILEDIGEVAEGVMTAKAINKISIQKGLYTPIAYEVGLMLDGKPPLESLQDLLKS